MIRKEYHIADKLEKGIEKIDGSRLLEVWQRPGPTFRTSLFQGNLSQMR